MIYDKAIAIGCYLIGLSGAISVLTMEHSLLLKISMLFINSITIFTAGLLFGSR